MDLSAWFKRRQAALGDCLAARLGDCDGRIASPVHAGDPLGGALEDVQLLVAFAAQSRRNVKSDKVTQLLAAADVIRAARSSGQTPTAAQLASFWTSYDAFAVDIAPLSAHSIRASQRLNSLRFPASLFTATSFNALMAVAVFVICLVLQAFWVAGDELIRRAALLDVQKAALQERQDRNDGAMRRANARLEERMQRVCELAPCAPAVNGDGVTLPKRAGNPADQGLLTALIAEVVTLRADVTDKEMMSQELTAEGGKLLEQSRPLQELLTKWHGRACEVCQWRPLRYLCPVDRPIADLAGTSSLDKELEEARAALRKADEQRPSAVAQGGNVVGGSESGYRAWVATNQLKRQISKLESDRRARLADNFRNILIEVRLIAANISAYLIAMSMGLLGALTFILRSLTTQQTDHTYVPVSVSISVVRLVLGAIAGVFGCLLVPGGELNKNLPPLFVPFVFGYGIEILFSLLDKTVRAFANPDGAAPRAT